MAPFVRRALVLPDVDIDAVLVAACGDDAFDLASLATVAAMNAAWGTKNGLARADIIAAWRARSTEDRAATLDDLHLVWAKEDGEMRKSEEHTTELQSLMRISYAVFCLNKYKNRNST